nr:hypothetical protein [Tanacetum cinerariifolium]
MRPPPSAVVLLVLLKTLSKRWRLDELERDTSAWYCSSSTGSVRGSGCPEIQYKEPSYNQNYDCNYYSHDLPSFPCCDYCEGSHENYQCQPMDHNIEFFGSDQIQNPQYPDVQENPLTNDEFKAFMKANDDKMNDLEIKFDQFQKQCEQMQDDLLNQMRNFIQNFQNGPPEASEEQKQKMEDTMLDLVKICYHKQFFCIHDDVDNLIERALDSKLLSINSINSQRLDKKEQEVKIVEEQPAERINHAEKSLKNFRVIHKSSISFNTSQISSIHEVAPILSTKEPEHSLSSDQIQTPQYPDVHENPLTNDEFKAFMKANDDKINNLETEFDHFQKQCEQMQDDLLNQMSNFIQNFQCGPPGEDKEHEATTDTKLFSTEDIQPLPVQEPPQNSDMHQIIEECCVEASEEQKQKMEDT